MTDHTDIVERLNGFIACDGGDLADVEEAAAEITRLRAEAEALRKALPVVTQALAEMAHAYHNQSWFTNGRAGATQQFMLWHRKASEALDATKGTT